MMSLAPPYYAYNGVIVFSDSNDPYTWYYYPNHPHFATDEQNRPAVRFLALKADLNDLPPGQDTVAGFLFFDTALDWPAETLARVAQRVQEDQKLDQLPRLVPLMYRAGTVRLMFLDQMTPDPNAPADSTSSAPTGSTGAAPSTGRWVTLLETSGMPSLYGENRAIFSATLTRQATELLYASFDGFVPAGVVYDLTFDGMQPAFHIHITADWHQVYNYIKEKHSVSSIFYSSDVEKTVSDLIDNKVLQLQATIEGVGEEGMPGQFEEARKQLLQFVLDNCFKPVPNPNKPPDTSIQDGVVDVAHQLRDLGSPLSVGYQRIEIDADTLQTFAVDYDVATAVQRHIAPQAHLSLFFSDYNLKREDVITVIQGDNAFSTADFETMVAGDFKNDGIAAVTVDLAYGVPNPPPDNSALWSFLFKDGTPQKKSGWYDASVGDQIQYRYETVFDPSGAAGPELTLRSNWHSNEGTVLVISPEDMYLRRTIEIQLIDGFPFDVYPAVEVELQYTDANSGWSYSDSTMLDKSTRTWKPVFRIHRDWSRATQYRLTYMHSAGNLVTDWQTTSGNHIDIFDPRTNLFTVHVIVGGDVAQLSQVVVDLRYTDQDNNIFETGSFTLDKTNFTAKHDWTFPRADPAKDQYIFSQVIVDTQGNVTVTGEVESNSPYLLVGPVFAKRWMVQPKLVGPGLADNGLENVTLALHYEDTVNHYVSDKTVVFSAPGDGDHWQLDLRDASARQYQYTVTYQDTSGFDHAVGPLYASDTFLTISSVPPPS